MALRTGVVTRASGRRTAVDEHHAQVVAYLIRRQKRDRDVALAAIYWNAVVRVAPLLTFLNRLRKPARIRRGVAISCVAAAACDYETHNSPKNAPKHDSRSVLFADARDRQ